MKNLTIIILILIVHSVSANSYLEVTTGLFETKSVLGNKKMKLSCSQPDAEIFVDGRMEGKGNLEIKIPDEGCMYIEVKKEGYISQEIEFCNKKKLTKLPSKFHFSLLVDEAFDVTIYADIVNKDFKIPAKSGKDTGWKLLNQIVLNNFDAIEMSDKETGYLRTSWEVRRFEHSAVRTRFIVKEYSSNPLVFKIKLASQHSQEPMANANAGEHFREWDRVLEKYIGLVSEIQARVK